jgi:hypothetical protein
MAVAHRRLGSGEISVLATASRRCARLEACAGRGRDEDPIFFSWQADTPEEYGRKFVEAALTRALELLGADTVVDPAIRDRGLAVDSDTRGIAGSPPIVDIIFKRSIARLSFWLTLPSSRCA